MDEEEQEQEEQEEKSNPLVQVVRMEDCLEEMLYDLKNGKEKGSTTYIQAIDDCWKWRKGEFNIWTGYANEGKSLFFRYLSIVKAIMGGWKFIYSAPEDFPAKEFYDDMIHTLSGQSTDRDRQIHISEEDYLKTYEVLKDSFVFVYIKPPNNTIKGCLEEFKKVMKHFKADAAVIDPLLKFARPKGMSERDDIYAAYITTLCTDFAREHNLSLHLVMHQLTPKIDGAGYYPKPSMYSIKGGGSWSDGTDNILSVQRPFYAKDKQDSTVIFTSQKIKKQKLVGIPQEFLMKFDRRSNRYTDESGRDLFDFDSIVY